MEMEAATVPPRAAEGRRYKALATWRFQHGFVRQPVKHAAAVPNGGGGGRLVGPVPDAKFCGSGVAPSNGEGGGIGGGEQQSRRCTRSASAKNPDVEGAENGGRPGSGNGSDSSKSGSDGGVEGSPSKDTGNSAGAGVGIGAREDCNSGRSGSDGGVEGSPSKDTGNSASAGVGIGAREDCNSGRSGCNGSAKDDDMQDLGGTGCSSVADDGAACDPKGTESNVGVENCVSEGLKKSVNGTGSKGNGSSASGSRSEDPEGNGGLGDSACQTAKQYSIADEAANGSTASNSRSEDPEGNGGLGDSACQTAKQCNMADEAANASNKAAKGCTVAGPGSNGNETYCRKGRKILVPWRFQVGYKRSFSKAFDSDNGSPDLPAYRAEDGSTQCTPATRSTVRCYASAHSGVRVSAMRGFSSLKGEKETVTAYKNMKTDQDKVMPNNGSVIARESVMRCLQDFRLIYRELLDEEEDNLREAVLNQRPDLQAYRIFRERFSKECDDKKYVGIVPGIHAGDIFHLRVELCVVGLHRPHRVGVDYIKKDDGTCIAISIVSYAQSSDVKNNLDVLVYSGSVAVTGNQKIEGTNLALKKTMDTNTPVRVIHGFVTHFNGNCRKKKFPTYIYGGLYLIETYWRQKECEDRYVCMFRLRRMEGQKHIDIKEILNTGKAESNDGIIMKDLSQGLERIPIPVVNTISDEYPMPYRYISRLQYPSNYQPTPSVGCGCVGGCSDSKNCACAVKNGGEIPFNDKGRIVEAKPLVYECGPSCKCPPTCHNRVGQHGIRFWLQVFKTKSMGWGVRTLDFIPSGSFVCEYIGEVLEDEEAQKRTTDEYLFAIGHNYYDESLWEGLSRSIPSLQKGPDKDDEAGFAVDASEMGNFAKFINHSCTPNLYAQNVLYDHDDKSVPHIMFFACDDIRPHQELAYHYNYTIDQVHDSNGNIKKKKCLCGSIECDGWLY